MEDKVIDLLSKSIDKIDKKIDDNTKLTKELSDKIEKSHEIVAEHIEKHEKAYHMDYETCKDCIATFKNKKYIIYWVLAVTFFVGWLVLSHGLISPELIHTIFKIFI